jgi:hypothetical protein
VTSVTPSSGYENTEVEISGSGFGTLSGSNISTTCSDEISGGCMRFLQTNQPCGQAPDTYCHIVSWTSTHIFVYAPYLANYPCWSQTDTGDVQVYADGVWSSPNAPYDDFTYHGRNQALVAVTPSSGPNGSVLSLKGQCFQSGSDPSKVYFGGTGTPAAETIFNSNVSLTAIAPTNTTGSTSHIIVCYQHSPTNCTATASNLTFTYTSWGITSVSPELL